MTHGHADHWFGAQVILDRFPGAELVARPAVVDEMNRQSTGRALEQWNERFPGQLAPPVSSIRTLHESTFELEGEPLVAVDLGHTDMEHTTCLHSPTLGLVAAGDSVYNGVHLLVVGDAQARREWLQALDLIEALDPATIVAGYKNPELADLPQTLGETRQYINDFAAVVDDARSANDIFEQMTGLHPDRLYPGALWASALAQTKRL